MPNAATGRDDVPGDLAGAIATVYGEALASFVARRDALARDLRAAGRRDEAAEVKRLRKPRSLAWALDAGALAAPDRVDELADAVAAVEAAQAGDGDVRAALARLREAEAAFVDASIEAADRHDNAVDRTALAAALRAVVGSPTALAELQAVRLVDTAPAGDGEAAAADAPSPRRRGGRRASRRPAGDEAGRGTDAAEPPGPDPAALDAARRAVDAAEDDERRAADAAETAAADAEAAAARAAEAEDEAAAARRRADEAAAAARDARRQADELAARREAAAEELARRRAALDDLTADA